MRLGLVLGARRVQHRGSDALLGMYLATHTGGAIVGQVFLPAATLSEAARRVSFVEGLRETVTRMTCV